MGLLNPGALYFFALIPALVVAYLARERPARVTVSSVLAFRALRGPRAERFRGRPRFNWMFFVELLILSLAVLAMAGPYITSRERPVAVVLDNSAAMQVLSAGGQTRFELAQKRLSAALADLSRPGEVTVYLTAPQPHRLADPFQSIAEARSAIGRVELTDAPDDPEALARMLAELASGARFSEVLFAGANRLAATPPPNLRAITVGAPAPNYAIGAFALRRESFGAESLRARVTVANFADTPRDLGVTISGDGHPLSHGQARLEPGEVGSIEFPALAPALVYRADLDASDAFPLDNTAYAAAGAVKSVAVLFVSPTPGDAAGLSTLPGVTVKTRLPDQFTPSDLVEADVAIFEYALPKEIPPINSLLVLPPPGDPLFQFATAPADNMQITGWRTPDPLTDAVNFRLLDLRRGEFFAVHPWMAPVVSGNGGGLILAGERASHRFVATGFNPFPYLGRKNLPMSVLTLNLMSYLAGLSTESAGYRTGEPWLVGAGVEKIVSPSGRAVAVKPGTLFTATAKQGIYQLLGSGGAKTIRAVNLADLATSDLNNAPALALAPTAAAPHSAPLTRKLPLAPWLVAAAIMLGTVEAIFAYRRRRGAAAVIAS